MTLKLAARFAALLALASSAFVISTVTPAHALVGLYRVDNISAANGTSPKNVSISCTAGDDMLSVGGRINNGAGDVVLTRAYLDPTGTVATASGIEAIATAAAWSVEVFAVCAPAGALTNRSIVQITSAFNNSDKTETAVCPAGDNIVGGGYLLDNAFGNVSIDEVEYNAALTSLSVTAYDNAAVGNYTLTVQAVCADPLTRSLQTSLSASNSISPKTMTTPACPGGTEVSAVGTEINGALGAASIATLNPRPQLSAGESTVREVGNFGGNWTSRVMAICIG